MAGRALKEPWFKAINPKSKVPTLMLRDGRGRTGFGAIAVCLARQVPTSAGYRPIPMTSSARPRSWTQR